MKINFVDLCYYIYNVMNGNFIYELLMQYIRGYRVDVDRAILFKGFSLKILCKRISTARCLYTYTHKIRLTVVE